MLTNRQPIKFSGRLTEMVGWAIKIVGGATKRVS
jgi:hypothetical protein